MASLLFAVALVPVIATDSAASAAVDTLVVVNGEAITSADFDDIVLKSHASGTMADMNAERLYRLFQKSINDRLIIQEANAIGLGEERAVREPLEEKRAQDARSAFVRNHFRPDIEVSESAVEEYFERYYWKIKVRQLSVRTEQRADSLRAAIMAGASMDTLARKFSLDTMGFRGGLHNLKYWADLENELRDASRDLEIGEISRPFRYREAFSVIRVEERLGVDQNEFDTYAAEIRSDLAIGEREIEWRRFVDELALSSPVTIDEVIMAEINADSASAFEDEFLEGSERPVLVSGQLFRDEYQVRKAISYGRKSDGLSTFATVSQRGVNDQCDLLIVLHAAAAAGYLDDPEVVARHEKRRDQAILEAYIAEFVASKIVFNRDEFQELYDENQDKFRGPDQVKLDTIVFGDEAVAPAIVFRLREGADFNFVAEQYADDPHVSFSRGSWASGGMFSVPIQQQIATMAIGDTSDPVVIPAGWLVFQLAGKRPGDVQPIEAVEMEIRQVMYQKKFNELMDEHLELLIDGSEIVRNDAAITKYFGE